MTTPRAPGLGFLATITVELGEPVEVGQVPQGYRRIVPITGGTVDGPELRGTVMAGGADFQIALTPELTELDARYAIATRDGETIYVHNRGYRTGEAADLAKLAAGVPVDPERIYFRTSPRLNASGPRWGWLNSRIFVANAERHPDEVRLQVFVVT